MITSLSPSLALASQRLIKNSGSDEFPIDQKSLSRNHQFDSKRPEDVLELSYLNNKTQKEEEKYQLASFIGINRSKIVGVGVASVGLGIISNWHVLWSNFGALQPKRVNFC
jgi:hypothetical protein